MSDRERESFVEFPESFLRDKVAFYQRQVMQAQQRLIAMQQELDFWCGELDAKLNPPPPQSLEQALLAEQVEARQEAQRYQWR